MVGFDGYYSWLSHHVREATDTKAGIMQYCEVFHTTRIGNAGLDIYSGYDAKQPKNVSGYSSPMLNDFTGTDKVYIVRGYTYLHKGIDGPAWLTYQQFELDSFTNMLFLFCGRHRGHIKGLYLEKDGIIILYKRLGQWVVPVDAFGI